MPGPTLVLCGPPGANTTATGRALAARLDVPFHDTDEAIEQSSGRPVADILVEDGELAYRDLERAEVLRALEEKTGVLTVGGGAVLDPQIQGALSARRVVFLDVRIADAAKRVGLDAPRPFAAVNPRATWTAMMNARRPVYERLAALRVDTSGKEPDTVAAEIADALAKGEGAGG